MKILALVLLALGAAAGIAAIWTVPWDEWTVALRLALTGAGLVASATVVYLVEEHA